MRAVRRSRREGIRRRPGPLTVAVTGSVDLTVPGTYTLYYTASNGFGPTTVTRTINVVDTTPPVLTLEGDAEVTIEAGSA